MRRGDRGSGLVESIAAVAIAGLLSAGWTNALVRQTKMLAEIRERSESMTLARNLLVHAASGDCGPAPDCSSGKTCRMTRTRLRTGLATSPPLMRLEVSVSSAQNDAPAVSLATLAYAGGVCG